MPDGLAWLDATRRLRIRGCDGTETKALEALTWGAWGDPSEQEVHSWPTWSPNGRVIMFTRETQGEQGSASLYSVDISGRNLKKVRTEGAASDPSWSPLQN